MRRGLKKLVLKFRIIQLKLVSCIILFIKPHMGIAYDNRNPKDGTGAQLQRLMGIYCLSRYLKLSYSHQGLLDVSTHPLDPFQTNESRKEFVGKVNSVFNFTSVLPEKGLPVYISKLRTLDLLYFGLKSRLLGKHYLLRIVEPFGVLDLLPQIYSLCPEIDFGMGKEVRAKYGQVVIHYRQGVGGYANYHKQVISRQIRHDYYLLCLNEIKDSELATKQIYVLTDAPVEEMVYTPPSDQLINWVDSPSFDGDAIHIRQSEIHEIFEHSGLDINYLHGGDPLEAIAIMANASTLVIGRSSLSYLGGILNKSGQVIFPDNFWHSPLSDWVKVKA